MNGRVANPREGSQIRPPEAKANGRFVDRAHFCALLISSRKLRRLNDVGPGVRGLEELSSGECFYIEEKELFGRPTVGARSRGS